MISLKDLHDATFVGLEVDWATGELRCHFRVSIGEKTSVHLLARGLTFLKVPRQSPWGRSISVNNAQVNESEKAALLLVIEMQSGDVIEANIQDVTLD